MINQIFKNFRSEVDELIARAVVNALRENDLRRNRDSRPREIHIETNREPRTLRNDERLMLDHGGSNYGNPSGDQSRDPTFYVTRDEFFREIGRIEGKIEQYRTEQLAELRNGFDRVDTKFQQLENTFISHRESVTKLTEAVNQEVNDVQNVKENVENMKKRLNNIDNEIHSLRGEIEVGFAKLENTIKTQPFNQDE